MAIEIVDFPMKDGVSFHSFLYVYQRVPPKSSNSLQHLSIETGDDWGLCTWK
jgi:hypothetical protein